MGLFAGPPALHGQVGNPAEVTGVLGDERQPMGERSGSDENVGIADELAVPVQLGLHGGGPRDDCVGQRQDVALAALDREELSLPNGPAGQEAAENLVACEDRKGEAPMG